MEQETTRKIVTANDLLSEEVVYLSASGKWLPIHGDAVLLDDLQADTRLAEIQKVATSVVGPYLATARSINVAQGIAKRFDELKLEHDIGHLKLKISGCVNACGHHHVGHIGILGLEKHGVESYQITLGGDGTQTAEIGKIIGLGFSADEIVPAIERLIAAYLDLRLDTSETFLTAFRRLGPAAFNVALYTDEVKHHAT